MERCVRKIGCNAFRKPGLENGKSISYLCVPMPVLCVETEFCFGIVTFGIFRPATHKGVSMSRRTLCVFCERM